MTYPITITRDAIVALDPCKDGLALFDEHYPDGVLVVADVQAHMALYSGPLAKHVGWAETGGLLPRVCAQGGDRSTLTGGNDSTLTGGHRSTLTWRYYDGSRFRLHTVYTGEDGIKQDTPYIGRFADGVFTVSEMTA